MYLPSEIVYLTCWKMHLRFSVCTKYVLYNFLLSFIYCWLQYWNDLFLILLLDRKYKKNASKEWVTETACFNICWCTQAGSFAIFFICSLLFSWWKANDDAIKFCLPEALSYCLRNVILYYNSKNTNSFFKGEKERRKIVGMLLHYILNVSMRGEPCSCTEESEVSAWMVR